MRVIGMATESRLTKGIAMPKKSYWASRPGSETGTAKELPTQMASKMQSEMQTGKKTCSGMQ